MNKNKQQTTYKKDFGPRHVTPQQQLWELTQDRFRDNMREIFRRIKKHDQEDLCLGMIAYIRFKIHRPFDSTFMQSLYEKLINLYDEENQKPIMEIIKK